MQIAPPPPPLTQHTRIRPKGRRWQPGQSGNPNGRPRSAGLVTAVRKRYGKDGAGLIAALDALAQPPTPAAVRLEAVRVLLEYGFGRPGADPAATAPAESAVLITLPHNFRDPLPGVPVPDDEDTPV